MGTDDDARIPINDSFFGKRYQKIPGGSIDLDTLKKISLITQGRSFLAKDSESLQSVLSEIQKLERSEIKIKKNILYKDEHYFYLLWGVLLLFFVEILRKFFLRELV